MLVLSRKVGEKIVIGGNLVVTITACSGDRVRLGFEGPSEIPIHREEIYRRLRAEENADRTRYEMEWSI